MDGWWIKEKVVDEWTDSWKGESQDDPELPRNSSSFLFVCVWLFLGLIVDFPQMLFQAATAISISFGSLVSFRLILLNPGPLRPTH